MALGCEGNRTVLPAGVHCHCELEGLMQAKLAGIVIWLTNTLVSRSKLKHWNTLKVPLVSSLTPAPAGTTYS